MNSQLSENQTLFYLLNMGFCSDPLLSLIIRKTFRRLRWFSSCWIYWSTISIFK